MEVENIRIIELNEIEEIDFDDENVRAPKKYIRDWVNPFEFYSDQEFKRRFRFNKESVLYGILPKIKERLANINNRDLSVPPVFQLLICLRVVFRLKNKIFNVIIFNIYIKRIHNCI